jgi:hypothetical protein
MERQMRAPCTWFAVEQPGLVRAMSHNPRVLTLSRARRRWASCAHAPGLLVAMQSGVLHLGSVPTPAAACTIVNVLPALFPDHSCLRSRTRRFAYRRRLRGAGRWGGRVSTGGTTALLPTDLKRHGPLPGPGVHVDRHGEFPRP